MMGDGGSRLIPSLLTEQQREKRERVAAGGWAGWEGSRVHDLSLGRRKGTGAWAGVGRRACPCGSSVTILLGWRLELKGSRSGAMSFMRGK